MIELIFVIVILGILASVAIPRLSSSRLDAEISAAIANLRTLTSDLSSFYVTNGGFSIAGVDPNQTQDYLKIMTNVQGVTLGAMDTDLIVGSMKIGDQDNCLLFSTNGRTRDGGQNEGAIEGNTGQRVQGNVIPAAIEIDLDGSIDAATGVCKQVLEAPAFRDLLPVLRTNGNSVTYGVRLGVTKEVYPK